MLPKDSACVRRSGIGTKVPGAIWHGGRVAAPSGRVPKEDAIELIKTGKEADGMTMQGRPGARRGPGFL